MLEEANGPRIQAAKRCGFAPRRQRDCMQPGHPRRRTGPCHHCMRFCIRSVRPRSQSGRCQVGRDNIGRRRRLEHHALAWTASWVPKTDLVKSGGWEEALAESRICAATFLRKVPEIIALADRRTQMTENVMCGRDVEKEIWKNKQENIIRASKPSSHDRGGKLVGVGLGASQILWHKRLKETNCLGKTLSQGSSL